MGKLTIHGVFHGAIDLNFGQTTYWTDCHKLDIYRLLRGNSSTFGRNVASQGEIPLFSKLCPGKAG